MMNRILVEFKLGIVVVLLWATCVTAPKPTSAASSSGVLAQSSPDAAPSGRKTHQLVFNVTGRPIRLVLSTSALGLAVIILLVVLLTVAVLLALVAQRKARHLEAANRQLEKEIQQRERSEEELRKATEMVHAVAVTAPLAISAIDLEGHVTFWNPASERLFGWSAAEVISKRLPVIRADAGREFDQRLKLYKEKGSLKSVEVKYARKAGTSFDANLWTAPLTDSQGKVVGTLGITADITEQKQAVEQLRLSELRCRQLADSMPQIVWTAAQDGSIEYLNQRWWEFTGYTPSNHHTEDVQAIIHSEDLPLFLTGWEAAVQAQEPYEAECRFADERTGGYRWFLCRSVPTRDNLTNSIRWFGTFTDIHEQKRIEAAFRRANEDLNRFAYSTNHDLQEPLRNVSSYSQLLEKRYSSHLNSEATSFIRFITRDAQRMCALITNLTVYTSAGNRSESIPTFTDANLAVDKALFQLQAIVSESQAVVVHTDLPRVRVAEKDLQQIFENLIQNAVQYRKANIAPRIDITAQHKRTEWIFSVQDNGLGIAADYTQHIFGVFRRLHGALPYGSIGMGLAICQKIIEHYGGRIWVESQMEIGSIFHFSLPAAGVTEMVPSQDATTTIRHQRAD